MLIISDFSDFNIYFSWSNKSEHIWSIIKNQKGSSDAIVTLDLKMCRHIYHELYNFTIYVIQLMVDMFILSFESNAKKP